MEEQITLLPKWFKGEIYNKGEIVTNPFSGESCELTAEELSIYDFIIGATMTLEMAGGIFNPNSIAIQKDLRKGLDWFRKVNPKAYMVLLD